MIPHSKPTLDNSDLDNISKTIKNNYLAQGPVTTEFEKHFSNFIGTGYAASCNSGSSAIHLSLLALNVQQDDEVIIPSYICSSAFNPINYVKAKPIIVDIEKDSFNADIEKIKSAITPKTKAIILPHMFGMPADIEKLADIDVPIIEDCAMSIGAKIDNKMAGSFGTISIFSFYASKFICTASGGMICTNNQDLYNSIIDLKDFDNREEYKVRYNYKMMDLQAALGLSQLSRINDFINRRKEIAAFYNDNLDQAKIQLPITNSRDHVYFRYAIQLKKETNLDEVINKYKENGIEVKRPVFKPLHQYFGSPEFPNTNFVYDRTLSLPIYPILSKDEASKIVEITNRILF